MSVYEYPSAGGSDEGKHHLVLSRERLLRPGDRIHVKGNIARDPEAKDWDSGEGEIHIIDADSLGVRWRLSLLDTLVSSALGTERLGLRELRQWGTERQVRGTTPMELADAYHSEPTLPEVFTLKDRARIESLTEKMLRSVEGTKRVDRKTELVYEP